MFFAIWIPGYVVVSLLWLRATIFILPRKNIKRALLINGGILTIGLVVLIIECLIFSL